jgi:hypothetical protein
MDWLKEMLKALGVEAAKIDAIVEKAEAEQEEKVAGLKQKNQDLLGKLKKKDDGEGGKVAELESKIDDLTDQLAKATRDSEKARKALEKERDDFKAKADAETSAVSRLVLDNGLTEALTKAGVRKELIPAARALLKEQGILSVKSDGDVRKAVAKLVKDGKEEELGLEDYITKHFVASESGKAFIPPSGNSGAGAGGTGGAGSVTGKKWADMSLKERTELFKTNPTLAAELQGVQA